MRKQINKHRGFSLIEIMVVVAIMGLLAAIVGTNVIDAFYKAKVRKARADFSNIESALKMYRLENGFYPKSDQGIQALVHRPSGHPEPKSFPKDGYLTRLPNMYTILVLIFIINCNHRPAKSSRAINNSFYHQ